MPDLVGVWRLITAPSHDETGAPLPPSYGPQPTGLVAFQADGRMLCVLCDGRRDLPAAEPMREYSSYCGNYTYDGKTLTTKPDASSDPARFTEDQVREVRFEGERLVLTPPPRRWRGKTQYRALIWERVG
jgi:hypothetical protein